MFAFTAEAGSRSQQALNLLASWTASARRGTRTTRRAASGLASVLLAYFSRAGKNDGGGGRRTSER